jgi:hypothetical protein
VRRSGWASSNRVAPRGFGEDPVSADVLKKLDEGTCRWSEVSQRELAALKALAASTRRELKASPLSASDFRSSLGRPLARPTDGEGSGPDVLLAVLRDVGPTATIEGARR